MFKYLHHHGQASDTESQNGSVHGSLREGSVAGSKAGRRSIVKTIKNAVLGKKRVKMNGSTGDHSPPLLHSDDNQTDLDSSEHGSMNTMEYVEKESSSSISPVPPMIINEMLPEPEIHTSSPASASGLSWIPFFDFCGPLFCGAPGPHNNIEDHEIIVHPPGNSSVSIKSPRSRPKLVTKPDESKIASTLPSSSISKEVRTSMEDLAQSTIKKAKMYLEISHGEDVQIAFKWMLQSLKNEVTIHSCPFPGDSAVVVRSKYRVKCTLEALRDAFLSEEAMYKLDATLENFERLELGLSENTFAGRYKYRAIFPLSPREFVALTTTCVLPDLDGAVLIATTSMPDELYPPGTAYLRAHVVMSCFLLTRVSAHETEVTMINHSHVGATVPMYIVNKAAVNIPVQYVRSLRRLLEKE